ncbi:retrovirus-related Pol polyprotein from transposon 17.6 [Trichonephila clavipes]|nr:retrovirus-related Pol polyprotein from transposon 17.6 [Trichonephila clavipes]
MHVEITISKIPITALCDTGSQAIIINEKTYQKLGYPTLNPSQCTFSGIGRDRVESKGYFKNFITIQNTALPAKIHVVNDETIPLDAIIGIDFLQQTQFTFGRDGIRIFRDVDECKNDDVLVNLANLFDEQCKLDLPHISNSKIRNDIEQLVSSYKPKKIYDTDLKMTILLSDDIPVSQRSRRLPFVEQTIVENQIQEWLIANIIKPSCSDYAAPIVLCKKKNGEHRLCVDFCNLNRKMIKDKFPLPLIEEVLDKLENSKVYTSLDLKNGFFHVPMDPNSTKYTSFVTHEGQYEFLRVPFGLSNSPSVFQRFIYTVFRKLIRDNILIVYMDDLLIPSQNEAEGLNKLRLVLQTAADFGLELNLKKCNFLQRKIEFLGYIIENGTIKPSPSKTQAVQNFPQPQTPRQLQKIASFQELKNILSENPALHVFQQGYPLELHTDASSLGLGAVLLQKSDDGLFHPIHYFSRKTTVQQEKYSSYELQVLAIIEALKKFRSNLLGTKFKIITDCDAIQKTMHKKDLPAKIARWVLMLEEFDYEVCHRPGPLPSTKKCYKHLFTVIDSFSKFVWIYPVKSTSTKDALDKLILQQSIFGNPSKIITDKGSAFTSTEFQKFCQEESIEHIQITTGVPRGNGQIERMHETIIPVLSKLTIEKPEKWFKLVHRLQCIMNSTTTRSTKFTPFEVLIGVKMKQKEDLQIKHLLEDELSEQFINKRETLRNEAKENILRL